MLPFDLNFHSQEAINQIRDEAMEKVEACESSLSTFYQEWAQSADHWRLIKPKTKGKPNGYFNSTNGETTRAVNTLASLWFRMLTASDPYIDASALGLKPDGTEITPNELYSSVAVLMRQWQVLKFKPKLLTMLRSLALFGTAVVEEPFVSLPAKGSDPYFEGTDFKLRSLLTTYFDTFINDISNSSFIATSDYLNRYAIRGLYKQNDGLWFKDRIEKVIAEKDHVDSGSRVAMSKIVERRQRAGYSESLKDIYELMMFHGKLSCSENNSIFQHYWESQGRKDDMSLTDWSVGFADGKEMIRFHSTPYGDWHQLFKTVSVNQFELESLGYGVGKLGKNYQRELNSIQSRTNDYLLKMVYGMMKVSKYAGLKNSQMVYSPNGIVELENPDAMKEMESNFQVIAQAMGMAGTWKEDFRAIMQATANLQASTTNATATEASLAQTEAIRGNSVNAEVIGEFLREHAETCHINNYYLLDNSIYVSLVGENKPIAVDKYKLPKNVGLNWKVTTDKDFRPEQLKKMLEAVQIFSSVRQMMPESMNVIPHLTKEIFRSLGLNPRLLEVPRDIKEVAMERLQKLNGVTMPGQAGIKNEVQSETNKGTETPAGGISTPVGDVSTSPAGAEPVGGGL